MINFSNNRNSNSSYSQNGKPRNRSKQHVDIRNPNKLNLELRNILRISSLLLLDSLVISFSWNLFKNNQTFLPYFFSNVDLTIDRLLCIFLIFSISFLYISGSYRRGAKSRSIANTFKALFFSFISLSIVVFNFFDRSSLIQIGIIWAFTQVIFISYRSIFFEIISYVRNRYFYLKIKTILIGEKEQIDRCLPVLNKSKDFVVVASFDISKFDRPEEIISIINLSRLKGANEILICSASWQKLQMYPEIFWKLRCVGISWQIIQLNAQIYQHRLEFSKIEGLTSIKVGAPVITGADFLSKRIFDVVVSALLLTVFALPMLVIALLISIDSSGKVFYKQTRVGLKGKHFKVWKFRTMVSNAGELQKQLEANNEIKGGILFKIKEDPRITKVGKYLRRYSLDELPQLFNVLRGEMSLVGPRPLPVRDVSNFSEEHHFRHQVLPGITGLWQVSGRSDTNSSNVFLLDFEYIKNWSLMLDFKILLKTIGVVFNSKGAY